MQAIEFLIHRGHAPQSFMREVREGGYTYDQIWSFYAAAQANAFDEYKQTLYQIRVAAKADTKGFKKYVRDIEAAQITKSQTSKPVTKQSLKMLKSMFGGRK